MEPVVVTIPPELVEELNINDPERLRQALILGLEQLRAERGQLSKSQLISALLETGHVRSLDPALVTPYEQSPSSARQEPPVLDGPPVSEIIIEQRRG